MSVRSGPATTQKQLPLFRSGTRESTGTWGGKRRGAGRKPVGTRAGVPHRARPNHSARHPVHVTLRAGIGSLRRHSVFLAIRAALAASRTVRVVHFSVQTNHLHLIVEAHDKRALCGGVRGLAISIARRVNRVAGRTGRVWTDRYHAHPLQTPREVRNALVYVLLNRRKHRPGAPLLDPCSSAAWFDGWKASEPPCASPRPDRGPLGPSPVAAPRTWLATVGWRRHGLVGPREAPKPE